jgi:PPP family 3-phenylpropionic acid transporter
MSARLALFYAAVFCIIGVQLPFWPVWLAAQGLSPAEIGVLLAATSLTRIAASPALAPIADRMGRRKPIIVALALGSLAATALFTVAHGFWVLFAVTVLAACFFTPLLPMTESHTVIAARDHGADYGRVRAVGSFAFIAMSTLSGRLLAGAGTPIVLGLTLGALALTAAASFGLPDLRTKPAARMHAALGLLVDRRFLVFILATALMQSSHVVYYGFASIHWRAVGLSDTLIGALWSEGVIAEIVLFTLSARVRLAPRTLLLIAAAGGVVRWCALGATDAIWALACVQTLHALTFGASHLAAIRFIMKEVPPEAGSTAQSLYFSLAGGGGAAIAMAAAGVLYADWGAGAYFAMAALALAGGVVAAGTKYSGRPG